MSWMRGLRYVVVGLGLAYVVPLACGGGVVGGECADGDPPDCIPAGNGTGGKNQGMGGASGNGNTSGNRRGDAGNGSAAGPQGGGDDEPPDGGFFDSPLDGQGDGGPPLECLPPHDAPSHCGDCETQCADPTP